MTCPENTLSDVRYVKFCCPNYSSRILVSWPWQFIAAQPLHLARCTLASATSQNLLLYLNFAGRRSQIQHTATRFSINPIILKLSQTSTQFDDRDVGRMRRLEVQSLPTQFFLFAQKFFFLFKVPSCCFAIGRANSNTAAVESLQGFIMHGQCIETDHSPSESTHEARGHAPTLISSNLTSKKGGSHILESGTWKLFTNQKCCSLLLNFSSNQCLATHDPKGGGKIPDSFSKDLRRGRSHAT